MAAIAFLQQAQKANAIKNMTTVQQVLIRSVTEILSDQAHSIICDERGKEETTEAAVGEILDEEVFTEHIRDFHERNDESNANVNLKDAKVINKPSASEEVQGLKSNTISKRVEEISSCAKTTSTNKDADKGPALRDILNDIQNVQIPIVEETVESSIDNRVLI